MADIQTLEKNLSKSVRQFQISQSLMFLNKVLSVSNRTIRDHETEALLRHVSLQPIPAFVIYLIVKYLMRHGRANTNEWLDWPTFPVVLDSAFKLAIADPISSSGDHQVLGSLVRMSAQQLRRNIPYQSYGLAIGLFQDLDAICGPKPIDLRAEAEAAIGMPIELFMRLGQSIHSATCGTHGTARLHGTLSLDWLEKAQIDLPNVPWTERWPDVAKLVAVDQKTFNEQKPQESIDPYTQYRFNPLLRHPVIQLDKNRFIAVDPWLIVERTSWGVFWDIFERKQNTPHFGRFLESFGYAFERFVGNLLESVIPSDLIWREATSRIVAERIAKVKRASSHRVGDFAVIGPSVSALIECCSKRPRRDLCEEAQPEQLEKTAKSIADEVKQTFEHISFIQEGTWSLEGLKPGEWVAVVVTFMRFDMVNCALYRKLIDAHLIGLPPIPYVVLSLVELDHVIRLVENGHDFGIVISKCAKVSSYDPTGTCYGPELSLDAISTFAKVRTERMYDFLPPDPIPPLPN